jgi:hypothetical protein
MIVTVVNGCPECGEDVELRTSVEQVSGACDPDECTHGWHAQQDDEAVCKACGAIMNVETGCGDAWLRCIG